ncbi:MAG: ABC transporter ATP-binding protein [Geobacteraceae bacterium]|nr:ABC transporter ATP-binding protein [Geobacteraceae bacterium]
MSPVIRVENLGKKYTLRHQQRDQYTAMRDVITDGIKAFARKLIHPFQVSTEPSPTSEDFWALKDVSFDVSQGDRIGIIGRNGAGKSTLLKILSRITEPTTGCVRIKGRVASLLEVGTGFHPELTGRENIFLNGAILGMGRAEIRKKFDEIVDFAEIEKFLDTPVKRYSSGMYVRLAFAVAAHLEPEILIVDEVLAVGDSQFQKKCLGKMEDVSAKDGRTVLFVSHNMGAVRNLCTSAILLADGRTISKGKVDCTIEGYLQTIWLESAETNGPLAVNNSFGIVLDSFHILNANGMPTVALESGKRGSFQFCLSCQIPYEHCLVSITVDTIDDVRVFALHNAVSGFDVALRPPGTIIRCTIPCVSLVPGRYRINFKLRISEDVIFFLPRAFELQVEDGDFFGTGRMPENSWGGLVLVEQDWSTFPFK